MLAWNVDNDDQWTTEDMEKALQGIDIIGQELAPQLFTLVWVGPGNAEDFLNKQDLEVGKPIWDHITTELGERWKS